MSLLGFLAIGGEWDCWVVLFAGGEGDREGKERKGEGGEGRGLGEGFTGRMMRGRERLTVRKGKVERKARGPGGLKGGEWMVRWRVEGGVGTGESIYSCE